MALIKTEAGQQAFKDRQGPIAARLRPAFILFDGRRTTVDVIAATGITADDVEALCAMGLLAHATPAVPVANGQPAQPAPAVAAASERSFQQRYQDAYLVATRLTGELGLRGFRLNLAVEAAKGYPELAALAPRIREAVGDKRYAALDRALNG